ncbi:MAG: hypothetical protein P8M68_03280 [Aquiluna sp.]|nr:hypothetical protein [Aquiluna sp.]
MSIEGWVLLATSLAGLYILGLIFYRVALAGKRLAKEVSKAKGLTDDFKSAEALDAEKLTPSTASELPELFRARRKRQRQKDEQAKARRRRLIKRISEIEIDKR